MTRTFQAFVQVKRWKPKLWFYFSSYCRFFWALCCLATCGVPAALEKYFSFWGSEILEHIHLCTHKQTSLHTVTLWPKKKLYPHSFQSTNFPTLAVLPRNSHRIHTDILSVLSPSCSIKPAIAWIQVVCFSLSAFLLLQCVWYEFRLCSGMTANTVPSSWMSPSCWCNRILILRLVLCSVASPDRDRGS